MSWTAISSLQNFVFLNTSSFNYFASTSGLPLSVKTVSNGRVLYKLDSKEVTIDDGGYLIVNNKQPYSIEIASPTLAESFVVRFPDGWADEVYRCLTTSADELLFVPEGGKRCNFFEKYTPHDSAISPRVRALRARFKAGGIPDDAWLEEHLRSLLYSMWKSQRELQKSICRIPALRSSTRNELWKRIVRGRDFLHSRCSSKVTFSDAARVACLSPFHFLRSFHAAFDLTPHQYLAQCRLNRAKFLLARTDLPITDVAFDSGFVTAASFSTTFRNAMDCSPRSWREARQRVPPQNRNIRKELLRSRL
jgi:AraC family transcriptional regulator